MTGTDRVADIATVAPHLNSPSKLSTETLSVAAYPTHRSINVKVVAATYSLR